jgi:hypothetical protein
VINLTPSMNTQETALPQRVVRSAKDLACATLSGTFELNDLQVRKHAGSSTSTRPSHDYGKHSSDVTRSRSILESRHNNLRDELNATACREAEEEFDRFQALNDFQEWQSPEFVTSITSLRDASVPHGHLHGSQDIPQTPLDLKHDEIVDAHLVGTTVSEMLKSGTGLANESECETTTGFAHKAAFRRLHQIGAHLQTNLAVQVLQQAAFEQGHASMYQILSHNQNLHTYQHVDDHHGPIRSDEVKSHRNISQENRLSQQPHESISRAKEPTTLPSEKEETGLQRQFHCPYYACHRNLQFFSTSGSSSSHRPCVHVGCGFEAETYNLWAEHVHVPHHDLLGSS